MTLYSNNLYSLPVPKGVLAHVDIRTIQGALGQIVHAVMKGLFDCHAWHTYVDNV